MGAGRGQARRAQSVFGRGNGTRPDRFARLEKLVHTREAQVIVSAALLGLSVASLSEGMLAKTTSGQPLATKPAVSTPVQTRVVKSTAKPAPTNLSSTSPLSATIGANALSSGKYSSHLAHRSPHAANSNDLAHSARIKRHHPRKKKLKSGTKISSTSYSAPNNTAVQLPNGADNPSAAPNIISCNPGNATGVIRTTLDTGGFGLTNNPDSSANYQVYTIHLSAQTRIEMSGDSGAFYFPESQTLCALEAYDPQGDSPSGKNLESVTFTFQKPQQRIRSPQQFFSQHSPTKVLFYVQGDGS